MKVLWQRQLAEDDSNAQIAHAPAHPRYGRAKLSLLALLPLVLAFSLLGTTSALAINRDTVLTRAQSWVDSPVPYSQSKHHLGYRTDCSGYVSMCWATGTSWSTSSFHAVSHKISTSQLKPGDAMLKRGYHIRLFYGWTDATHTSYVAYEAGSLVAIARVHSLADDLAFGYVPTRYNHISDGPVSTNVLRNRSFDVWTRSWGQQGDQPVWWQVAGPAWQALAVHRTDVHRTGHNSLQLLNPSSDPGTYTQISQAAPVTAGASYRLSAWAKTPSNPAGIELSVAYLNAGGQPVAETRTTGDGWGIGNLSFKQMSATTTAPTDAVNAVVTVRLAGGSTPSGTVDVPGTAVVLDDVSLARPQAAVGIKTSATTSRSGRVVVLSGLVAPSSAVGVPAIVYVQRPGLGWRRLASSPIYASGGSAVWRTRFAFTRKMRKGVYRFRTTVPAFSGYLGSTSGTVSVRLR